MSSRSMTLFLVDFDNIYDEEATLHDAEVHQHFQDQERPYETYDVLPMSQHQS